MSRRINLFLFLTPCNQYYGHLDKQHVGINMQRKGMDHKQEFNAAIFCTFRIPDVKVLYQQLSTNLSYIGVEGAQSHQPVEKSNIRNINHYKRK